MPSHVVSYFLCGVITASSLTLLGWPWPF